MNKKMHKNKKKGSIHIKKSIIALIVGVGLLFVLLAFGSGIAVRDYILTPKTQPTPTLSPITVSPTATPTEAPQAVQVVSNCSKYDFEKVKNGLLQLGMPVEQIEPYLTLWKSKGCPNPKTAPQNPKYESNTIPYNSTNNDSSYKQAQMESKQRCQQEMSEYAVCISEFNAKMIDYNDCFTEYPKYRECVKPYSTCGFKPSCF